MSAQKCWFVLKRVRFLGPAVALASAESGRRVGTSHDGRHQHGSWMEEEMEEEESPGLLGDVCNGPTNRRSGRNCLFGSGASCFWSEMRLD